MRDDKAHQLVKRTDVRPVASGTTPKIRSSAGGSMLLSIPKTPIKHLPLSDGKPRAQEVLDEDEYIAKLEDIIERDYFPGIKEMQKRIDMIDYMLKRGEMPSFDKQEKDEDDNLSLTEFQRKKTSEDNDSFGKLMARQAEQFRDRYPWLWKDDVKGITGKLLKPEQRSLPSTGKNKRTIELVARMTPQIEHENEERARKLGWTDRRATSLDSWQSGPRNNFMSYPETSIDLSKKQVKAQAEKKIEYGLTRFSEVPGEKKDGMTAPSRSQIIESIMGKATPKATENGAPEVNGYGFVTEKTYQPTAETSRRSFTMANPTNREEVLDRLINKKIALRKREKTNPMGVESTPTTILTHTQGKVTKTPARSRGNITLTPAGSHLLSSLKRNRSTVASSPTIGRTFSSPVVKRPSSSHITKPK